jgi:hypothetical protein
MEFDNAPLHVKNVQIKNCRWRDYGGAFIIGPPVNNNHTNAVIEQMQISGISVLETNVGVTSTLTNRALVYCPNGVIFTNLMISDVMWTRSTNSAVGNRDFIVFNDVGGIINNLSLDNLVLSTNMASTITNAGTILKTNAPIMFNGGVNAIVGTDGGDRLGAHLKTLVIGSGLSSDGTTLTATGGGGSGSASNAVSAILTNSVSIAASGVIESNLNLIGNDITVTGAVSSGQANIGLTVSSNTLKGVVLINPTANGLSVTGASPGTITFSNSAGTARQIFIDGPNAQTTDTNGFSSDFVNFMRPPTNAAFSGAVVMATGASGATAFREAATNAFLLTSGALLIGNGGNGINSSGNGFSGSDGHWLTNATKNFPLVIDDVYERGRFQITNTQGTNTLTSSNMSIVPIGNTSVGYSSDSSHYTQMPTNTPTDTYVMTAVGTAGNTKWAASSGGAGGAPTITQTNWLINNVYTVGAAPILALAYVSLQGPATAAAGAGGIMSIYADQAGGSTFVQIASVTNGVALQPTVAVLLEGVLKAGATFYITNESVGTGANAIFGNQGYTVTLTGATGATGATGPAPFPLNADTNVGNFGLTNVAYININSNINYSTNTGGIIPDMRKGYQMITTNAAFTFLAPIGVDTTKTLAQTAVVFITNSTAAAVVMTPQVAWHIQGTWYVTNVSSITVFQYAQVFTNAVALPLW